MSWTIEESLNEYCSVTECGFGFGHSAGKAFFEFGLLTDDSHSSTASAHSGFNDDRKAVLFDERVGKLVGFDGTLCAGYDWDAGSDGWSIWQVR